MKNANLIPNMREKKLNLHKRKKKKNNKNNTRTVKHTFSPFVIIPRFDITRKPLMRLFT